MNNSDASDSLGRYSSVYSQSTPVIVKQIGDSVVFQPAEYLPKANELHTIHKSYNSELNDNPEEGMSTKTIGRIEFWLGIAVALVTIVGASVSATWSVSNAITSKNDSLRSELNQNISSSKQEITSRIDRIEDKVDSGFKDVTSNLNDLKVILATQKNDKKPQN
ncbi:hypothetical protein [Pluralibacter gergoviae]|uniref:hypothetical protein n=1 Tax=Pluralibacter gergoviae TaxID=61647 RepID=UPI000E005DA8|nr:hypothetical protein [Pluralibacter gergoviae]SUB71831.1 Uncharacterised protein [Pluralibacter gergoviae]